MKVLFLSPAAELGGAERCLLDCVAALRAADRPVDVAILSFADGPMLAQARALGAATRVLEPPRGLAQTGESDVRGLALLLRSGVAMSRTLPFMAELRAAIAAERPDVVHTNGMKAHLLGGALAPFSARLVVHLHDFIGRRAASRRLLPALGRLRKGTTFLANSHAVAQDFAQLLPSAVIRTVHNVVDIDYFRPGDAEPEWLAHCAGLEPPEPGCVSFGLVATYAHWKGHELFIRAAGRLRAEHPEACLRFYVVGGPIYQTVGSQVRPEDLRSWARETGVEACFALVGFQDDIARVYRSLNVVVHASTEPEPFGRTIVEAMACARPVLVARGGGAAELFQHGENALGFTIGSDLALSKAMAQMLDSEERLRLGRNARAHASSNFASARLSAQLLSVYGYG